MRRTLSDRPFQEACTVLGQLPVQNLHGLQSVCRGSCPNYSPNRPSAIFLHIQPQAVKLKKALAHWWVEEMAAF